MAHNVLIDAQMEESGIAQYQPVYVQLVDHGMDLSVLYVQMEELGIWILEVVNVQFHQLGME